MNKPLECTGYVLMFTKKYVADGRAVDGTLDFKVEYKWLLETIVEQMEKFGKDNPGTDQFTGEKFYYTHVDWSAVYA